MLETFHDKMFERKQPTTARRISASICTPDPSSESMPLTSTWRGPDSTVQLVTWAERRDSGVCSDRQRQRDKGLEISVYTGPSVTYRGSKPPEKRRPTQTEAARATSMAGKTGKKKI